MTCVLHIDRGDYCGPECDRLTAAWNARDTCPECGCTSAMHFSDGCHTASGFICRCRVTDAELGTGAE